MPFISKIIIKPVFVQIQDYVSANKLNNPLQSACKANHYTKTALLKIWNDILTEIDQGNAVMATLLDLFGFDTLNHNILLRWLWQSFEIDSTCLKWLESYITGRSQHVMIKGSNSEEVQLSYSVLQGPEIGADLYSTSPLSGLISRRSLSYHF